METSKASTQPLFAPHDISLESGHCSHASLSGDPRRARFKSPGQRLSRRYGNRMPRCDALAGRAVALVVIVLTLISCSPSGTASALGDEPGSVQEFPVSTESFGESIGAMVRGSEGSIWFTSYNLEDEPVIDRMSPTGLVTGEFVVPGGTQVNLPERSFPIGLAVGPDGDIWFTDAGENSEKHHLIGRITPAGKILEFPDSTEAGNNAIGNIAAGGDGDMWFIDGDAIRRISPNGVIVGEFTQFGGPSDIAAGSDGAIWFTDDGYIGKITSTGLASEFRTPGIEPTLIVRGREGSVWFTGYAADGEREIGLIASTGLITRFPVPEAPKSQEYAGFAMVEGPDGNLWFTEAAVSGLWKVSPEGVFTGYAPVSLGMGEPGKIVVGSDNNLWFSDITRVKFGFGQLAYIARFITPFAPVSVQPPALSGQAVEGQGLSVSEGTWSHGPNAIAYRWQLCNASGGECADMSGQIGATHLLGAGDVGHTLRAVVTASNIGGASSVASSVSSIVLSSPPAPSTQPLGTVSQAPSLSLVDATMTWRFKASRKYTTVQSLVARSLIKGVAVTVGCHGRGCPFSHQNVAITPHNAHCRNRRCKAKAKGQSGEFDLTRLFRNRRLVVGARIAVTISKAGWVGKSFLFAINSGREPDVEVSCSNAGSLGANHAC